MAIKHATAPAIAATKKFDAVICVGAVIRGATPHFDYVASEVAKGVAQVNLETGVPVIFGVLTTDNIEQAVEARQNEYWVAHRQRPNVADPDHIIRRAKH